MKHLFILLIFICSSTLQALDIQASKKSIFVLTDQPDKLYLQKILHLPEDSNPLKGFESLTEEEQKKFLQSREAFLRKVALILHYNKWTIGIGQLTGDQIEFLKTQFKKVTRNHLKENSNLNDQDLITTEVITTPLPKDAKKNIFGRERMNQWIHKVLQAMDAKLWFQAPLVANANEWGMQIHLGLIAESGARQQGFGGSEELGLYLAYNKTQKNLVFEVIHQTEKFNFSHLAFFATAIQAKAGFTMRSTEETTMLHNGQTFYPPAVPGYIMLNSPDYFSTGFSSSLGLPPPGLADLQTWQNDYQRRTWLRIGMGSHFQLRVQNVGGSLKIMSLKVVNALKFIPQKILQSKKTLTCSQIFQTLEL